MRYVVVVEKDQKKMYVQVDQNTGKGSPVDDPKLATAFPNRSIATFFLSIVRPVIEKADPGVKVTIEGV